MEAASVGGLFHVRQRHYEFPHFGEAQVLAPPRRWSPDRYASERRVLIKHAVQFVRSCPITDKMLQRRK